MFGTDSRTAPKAIFRRCQPDCSLLEAPDFAHYSGRHSKEPKKTSFTLLFLNARGPGRNCPFSVHVSNNRADGKWGWGGGVGGLEPGASVSGPRWSNVVESRGRAVGPVAPEEASSRPALGQSSAIVYEIWSAVLRGVSHEGRLIGRGARNQEQVGNRDMRVRQVWAISAT